MNVLEKNLFILKVKQSGHAPAGGHGLEKFGSGLIGVDTRRREQTHQAVGFEQIHGTLHEQRVQVDVATAEQGVVAGGPNHPAQAFGLFLGRVELVCNQRPLLSYPLNGHLSRRGGRRERNVRVASRKPFHFLKFDAVPGRVADHRVKAARRADVLPMTPHPRKGRLPVQKAFTFGNGSRSIPQFSKLQPRGIAGIGWNVGHVIRPFGQKLVGVLGMPERRDQWILKFSTFFRLLSRDQPPKATEKVQEPTEFRGRLLYSLKQRRRLPYLGNVGV